MLDAGLNDKGLACGQRRGVPQMLVLPVLLRRDHHVIPHVIPHVSRSVCSIFRASDHLLRGESDL
jgi:hypothetical protein